VAADFGLAGVRVEKPEQIKPAWEEALRADRPTVLDVLCDANVPPIPPHASLDQMKATAGALLHGDEDRWAVLREGIKTKAQELMPKRGD
ncbi:MAG TPA: thiamine pyrophosphate-requiring protein, partial [Nocardioidaceae bacterium]|nr:thiamine pyrophosphate-requiring protein [Nocardioidaceae bacterium]